MEEKTLLVETEREKAIEKKFDEYHLRHQNFSYQEKNENSNLNNSKTYPQTLPKFSSKNENQIKLQTFVEQETSEESSVIEKPNYDMIEELSEEEREKVYVIDKDDAEPQQDKKKFSFKKIVISILFGIFGIWGIVNITQIDLISSQVADASSQYSMNLANYLNNLRNLDATNSENMQTLFETIPDQEIKASGIEKQSNWFDRFCNFLGGLFGG